MHSSKTPLLDQAVQHSELFPPEGETEEDSVVRERRIVGLVSASACLPLCVVLSRSPGQSFALILRVPAHCSWAVPATFFWCLFQYMLHYIGSFVMCVDVSGLCMRCQLFMLATLSDEPRDGLVADGGGGALC